MGHVLVLLLGTIYYLKRPLWGWQAANWYYQQAYLGALASYSIVVYKTYGPPQLSLEFFQRLMVDENFEYLALAFMWYIHRPIFVTLLPFVVFSLFHVLTYIRNGLLPMFFDGVNEQVSQARQQRRSVGGPAGLSIGLGDWSSRYYGPALREVGVWEVGVVGGWLVLGALTWQTPLYAPFVYFHFLKLRYALSPSTRQAFGRVRGQLDKWVVDNPSVPGVVADTYVRVRDFLVNMGNMIMDPSRQSRQRR